MRKTLRKILEILDGTPSVYGERQRGQSTLEMAFITPLLIILIVGIVEIGWLANNYLTLQEVTKVGARRGTVLPGDLSPIAWEVDPFLRQATYLPRAYVDPIVDPYPYTTPAELDTLAERDWDRGLIRYECNDANLRADEAINPGLGSGNLRRAFYNEILCVMFDSLDPLTLDRENGIDDIIISVFAVQTLWNDPNGNLDLETGYTPVIDTNEYDPGWIPVVVGRYPALANECNVLSDGTPLDNADNPSMDIERDPFDYYNDGYLTYMDPVTGQIYNNFVLGSGRVPIELATNTGDTANPIWQWASNGYDQSREMQRGFSLYGNHQVETITVTNSSGVDQTYNVLCYGSEWSIYDVEDQISVPEFEFTPAEAADPRIVNDDTGEYLPNQGLVLVEMYWQHHLLLNLPVFSPVMQALGDNRATIYVWSVFPVPTAEPNIIYPFP